MDREEKAEAWIRERLQKNREAGLARNLPEPLPDGVVDFRSNDHLGLGNDRALQEKIHNALQRGSPMGSSGSRLISGNSREVMEMEEEMAKHYEVEAGLLFSSGYQANVGTIAALGMKGNTLLYDEKVHASMRDGVRMSLARAHSFQHNDPQDLQKKLERAEGVTFILLEGLYSMDGDQPPLQSFLELAEHYGASIILDEAHSNAVFGNEGRGIAVQEGVENRIFARIMPFGKAVAQQGAFVGGSEPLRDFLLGHARSFIYSTAPSFPALVALRESFRYAMSAEQKREALFERVRFFRKQAEEMELPISPDASGPIQALFHPGNEAVQAMEKRIMDQGIAVKGMRKPTVPQGSERIRVVLHADTQKEDIERLLKHFKEER